MDEILRDFSASVFASGMAAVAATLGITLKAGDILVMPSDAYYTTRMLANGFFTTLGVEVRLALTAGSAQREQLPGATLLWLESPSNPGLDVCDIALLTEAAHAAGTLVVVDNTTPTCLGQQPLVLGAHFSLSSDTKATTGHSDLVLGHVSVRDSSGAERLRTWRMRIWGQRRGQWRCGWPIVHWRRLMYGWNANARMRLPLQSLSLRVPTCTACAIPDCPATPSIQLPLGK